MIDYLAKKGYTKTEAMLRMESANQQIDGRALPQLGEDQRPKYRAGFGNFPSSTESASRSDCDALDLLKNWIEDNLDLYKVW